MDELDTKRCTMRAAIYSRFSTDKQRPESIDAQVRLCTEYATKHNWKIVATYADAGISGTGSKNRPGYQRMLAAAEAHEFDVLLCEDLSRLTRDEEEGARVAKRFKYWDIRIVGVGENFDSAAGGADLQRTFKSAQNAMDVSTTARRVHRQLRDVVEQKRWAGGRVFGYSLKPVLHATKLDQYDNPLKVGTVLVIDETQAAVVRRIFEAYLSQTGYRAIASMLNSDKVPSPGSHWQGRKTRRANGWMASAVRNILRNELYVGTVRWNKRELRKHFESEKRRARMRDAKEWFERRDESLRIIAQPTWDAVQARSKVVAGKWGKNGGRPSGGGAKYLLSGLLVCDKCDSNFVMINRYQYSCSSSHGGGKDLCTNQARPARRVVENRTMEHLRDQLLAPAAVDAYVKEFRRYYAERVTNEKAATVRQPKELADVDVRIKRLQGRIKAGDPDLSAEELEAALERLREKRRTLIGAAPKAGASRVDERVLALVPVGMATLRREIELGFANAERTAGARLTLRRLLPEGIRLKQEPDGAVTGAYKLSVFQLVAPNAGPCGSGGVLCAFPKASIRHRVK